MNAGAVAARGRRAFAPAAERLMPEARKVRVDADIEWRVERTSSPPMLVAVCDGR